MKRSIWAVGLVAVAALGVMGVLSRLGGGNGTVPEASVPAAMGTVQAYVRAQGTVDSEAKTTMRAKTRGLVLKVSAKEGDQVRPGVELLQFDRVEAQERFNQQRERFQTATFELEHYEQEHQRMKTLVEQKLEAPQQLDQAKLKLDQARAAKRQAAADLNVAKDTLEKLEGKSPQAGTVVAKLVEDGQSVAPGQDLFIVADLSRLKVECKLDEVDAAKAAVGQRATVTSESFPGVTWEGAVIKVSPRVEMDAKGEYPVVAVEIQLAGRDLPLKIGNRVDAKIILAERQGVLTVPAQALRKKGDAMVVYVREGVRWVERPVKVGLVGVHEAEITEGVAEGARVALAPPGGS